MASICESLTGVFIEGKDTFKGIKVQGENTITVKQLSARIGYHEITIYRWIKLRNMPVNRSSKRGGISIDWDEFKEWWRKDKNERWERA